MRDRSPQLARVLALLLAAAPLAACSGTPFGEQLSGSFSSPAPAAPSASTPPAEPAAGSARPAQPAAGAPSQPAAQQPTEPPPRAPVLAPAPYRITIKLVGADPAAPAEAVTQALRAAGVPFEVEMIERVPGSGASPLQGATPSPAAGEGASTAPAPSPAPAASPRPAPPPR